MDFTDKVLLFNITTNYTLTHQSELIGINWLGMIQSLVVAGACLLLIFKVVRKINEAKFHWLMVTMLLTN